VNDLTPGDRTVMARARGLAAACGDGALRAWFRSQDDQGTADAPSSGYLFACATGALQHYVNDLISIIERLGGHPYVQPPALVIPLPPGLDPGQLRGTLLNALEEAASCRREYEDGYCRDCGELPEGVKCGDHSADAAMASMYDLLHEQLQATFGTADGES